MKARIIILATLVVLLLAGSVASAQPAKQAQSTWYTVERGSASGGGYHLVSQVWQVGRVSSGAGYHLQAPMMPASSENGCCCTFLPCILRSP